METVQAIVVLDGGVNGRCSEYETEGVPSANTLIRLNYAAYLAHKYPNLPIITSGGVSGVHYAGGKVMRHTLLKIYRLHNPIFAEIISRNTDENAKYVTKMLLAKGIKKIALVSQAYHLKRASMLFRKYGINPIPAPTDYVSSGEDLSLSDFLPSAAAMSSASIALHEIIGYWYYS